MGYRVSWIARRGTAVEELLAAVGYVRTGTRSDMLDCDMYLLQLPGVQAGGWSVVIADGTGDYEKLSAEHARAISNSAETIYFRCSDTTMTTVMSGHLGGQRVWSIEYAGDTPARRLEVDGTLPNAAREIIAKQRELQGAADTAGEEVDFIYDVTAELGRTLVGFRHDVSVTGIAEPYELLASCTARASTAREAPWWKFWSKVE